MNTTKIRDILFVFLAGGISAFSAETYRIYNLTFLPRNAWLAEAIIFGLGAILLLLSFIARIKTNWYKWN